MFLRLIVYVSIKAHKKQLFFGARFPEYLKNVFKVSILRERLKKAGLFGEFCDNNNYIEVCACVCSLADGANCFGSAYLQV